jgi:AraC family transcriptional regulator
VPASARRASADLSAVLPALLAAHVDLGGDLRTETLAQAVHMSRARFHTVFTDTVGETVKQHTLRLRLERAAFRLLSETTDVSAIAFDLGFGSHEAFSRQFRSRFGQSPSGYRADPPRAGLAYPERRPGLEGTTDGLNLSETRAVQLAATAVVFRRHTGPYENVRPEAFDQLVDWARRHDVPCRGVLGIAHDAPGITPPDRLRFDLCAVVTGDVPGDSTTAYRVLPQRWASSTWFAGPESRLGEAVAQAHRASSALAGFAVTGLPLEEHYTSSRILTGDRIETLRLLVPLVPRGSSACIAVHHRGTAPPTVPLLV